MFYLEKCLHMDFIPAIIHTANILSKRGEIRRAVALYKRAIELHDELDPHPLFLYIAYLEVGLNYHWGLVDTVDMVRACHCYYKAMECSKEETDLILIRALLRRLEA